MTKRPPSSTILATLVATAVLSLALLNAAPTDAQGQTLNTFEQQVFDLMNQQRAANSLPPLIIDMRLVQAARNHNQAMIQANAFAHQVPGELPLCASGPNNDRYDAVGYPWNMCAENIAAGYDSPQAVMAAWMGSPGHRANILSSTARDFGVGYTSASNTTYTHYWTQDFGRTSTSPPAATATNTSPAQPSATLIPTRTPTRTATPVANATATRTATPVPQPTQASLEGVTTGVFRSSNGAVYLKNSNISGNADVAFVYGIAGDRPVAGDWNGDGRDSIGIYRSGVFFLKNTNSGGNADMVFGYGVSGDLPISGDWDGNGSTTIGVFRNGTFFLRNSNSTGPADLVLSFGALGDVPIAGDWTGGGRDLVGVYRSPGLFFLRNSLTGGAADAIISFGLGGDQPAIGDWDNNTSATIGVYRSGVFYLRNSNTGGAPDRIFSLGINGDIAIAGDWDGAP